MRVIPVLDLLGGQVVRGVGGRRHEYLPIVSTICNSAEPEAVAAAFAAMNLELAYVADLDALAGRQAAWDALDAILDAGLALWIDPGLRRPGDALRWARFADARPGIRGIVAALETLPDADALRQFRDALGPRLVFSLDLEEGIPRTGMPSWSTLSPLEIAATVVELGIERCIVLDLKSVGMDKGPQSLGLCHQIHSRWPHVDLVTGGGVRGLNDLQLVAHYGCWGALVASALHDGRLTQADLVQFQGPGSCRADSYFAPRSPAARASPNDRDAPR